MAKLDFLNRLGIFTEQNFLDTEFCTKFISEAHSATINPVKIVQKNGHTGSVSTIFAEQQRKTDQIIVSSETEQFVRERLQGIKPLLEKHFNLSLTDCQKPLFYVYKKGDFFEIHQDSTDLADAPEFVQQRRVSVVIFLNNKGDDDKPGCYSGGALSFYGLIADPQWQEYGFPLSGEEGLLVAFPSNVLHEVKPVTSGERYTIVSWFY
jgi:SM-20-related protein